MAPFGRSSDLRWRERDDEPDSIAELWRRALSAGFHGAGCACGIGGFTLTAGDLEADILDFLAARYPRDRAPALAEALAARRTGGGATFPAWFDDTRTGLDEVDRERLDSDVRTVLTSIGGASGGFVCA